MSVFLLMSELFRHLGILFALTTITDLCKMLRPIFISIAFISSVQMPVFRIRTFFLFRRLL